MSSVAVEKVRDGDATPSTFFDRLTDIGEKIRQRAYEIFQCRTCAEGHSLDDWLRAERETIRIPEAELIEKDGKFQIRLAVPGFDSKEIRVTATPMGLVIEAESKHEHKHTDGDVYYCEFRDKHLFRKLDLPGAINVDKVTAHLENGILQLTASKTVDASNKVKVLGAA
jgi:HSP20 family protein